MAPDRTCRVAIVGTGPAGMYALEHLLETRDLDVEVDLFERLPTPWGLVRAGVAPDHPEKKWVVNRLFDYFFRRDTVRFFGNVEIGSDILHGELADWYDGVIYAIGANSDTRMGIEGEELPGCRGAREFVAWYNGHPDYSHLEFDFSTERAVIVGNGNVALDVARILTLPLAELEQTDIADHALVALRASRIREVVLLGRRGHLQGAFNNPELEELLHLENAEVLVEPDDLLGGDGVVPDGADWEARRKAETLRRLAEKPADSAEKRIVFRFLSSPVELLGDGRVEQVLVARNHLEWDEQGRSRARPTAEQDVLETGLVLRAIGYRGSALPGLPFDEHQGVVPNESGRVVENGKAVPGSYVTGWIKRGPRGLIGSNKKCARDTVRCLLQDLASGQLTAASLDAHAVLAVLRERKPQCILKSDWLRIDHAERVSGRAQGRPRVKLTTHSELLAAAGT